MWPFGPAVCSLALLEQVQSPKTTRLPTLPLLLHLLAIPPLGLARAHTQFQNLASQQCRHRLQTRILPRKILALQRQKQPISLPQNLLVNLQTMLPQRNILVQTLNQNHPRSLLQKLLVNLQRIPPRIILALLRRNPPRLRTMIPPKRIPVLRLHRNLPRRILRHLLVNLQAKIPLRNTTVLPLRLSKLLNQKIQTNLPRQTKPKRETICRE